MYYAKHKLLEGETQGGIDFPGEEEADYSDFAYFSYTIGMTAQVSDTAVTTRSIRRVVLLHGLISFAYNAIIIALTISIVSGLF
jgi:uncharacterized membrane protein